MHGPAWRHPCVDSLCSPPPGPAEPLRRRVRGPGPLPRDKASDGEQCFELAISASKWKIRSWVARRVREDAHLHIFTSWCEKNIQFEVAWCFLSCVRARLQGGPPSPYLRPSSIDRATMDDTMTKLLPFFTSGLIRFIECHSNPIVLHSSHRALFILFPSTAVAIHCQLHPAQKWPTHSNPFLVHPKKTCPN